MCKLPLVALHLDILEALAVNDEYSRLTTLGSSLAFILGVVSKALFLLSKEPKTDDRDLSFTGGFES